MMTVLNILQFLGVLSFLVTIHELGHFIIAKWRGGAVEEFGLGYPPKARTLFKWRGTDFSLNWIPFGGFVKLYGEDGPEQGIHPSGGKPFYVLSKKSRLAIILAGATVNFLFGVIAFSIYFSVKGIPALADNPRIGNVAAESPAARAGVPAGVDVIGFEVNGEVTATSTPDQVISFVTDHQGQQVVLITTGKCQDTGCQEIAQRFPLTIRTREEIPAGQGALGVQFEPVIKSEFFPWYEMPFRGSWYGIQQAFFLGYFIIKTLGQMIINIGHGQLPSEVAGPVGIFDQAQTAGVFSQGWFELLNFAGLLSVNLAIMNVLPIPALDGGRALFLFIEAFIGQKKLHRIEGYVNYAAFGLLLLLTALITVRDVHQLFTK